MPRLVHPVGFDAHTSDDATAANVDTADSISHETRLCHRWRWVLSLFLSVRDSVARIRRATYQQAPRDNVALVQPLSALSALNYRP